MEFKPNVHIIFQMHTDWDFQCICPPPPLGSTGLEGLKVYIVGDHISCGFRNLCTKHFQIRPYVHYATSIIGIQIHQCLGVYSKDPQEFNIRFCGSYKLQMVGIINTFLMIYYLTPYTQHKVGTSIRNKSEKIFLFFVTPHHKTHENSLARDN